jgi:hypothetical protein
MKRQLKRRAPDGSEQPVFPERNVCGIPVRHLSEDERALLADVSRYCSRTAKAARGTDEEDLVSFAMQILKKRALSSRAALATTLERRLAALQREGARETPPDRAELRDLQAGLPLSDAAAERTADRVLRSAIPADEKRRRAEVKALRAIKKALGKLPPRDPKLEAAVAEILSVLDEDPHEKLIVFTEYLDTIDALVQRFDDEARLRGRYVLLRGGLSRKQRAQRQARFDEIGTRVLLATDAASEGLNLQQHCRRVLHFELPWNPNRLEQRNGRVDRYGQTRNPEIRYLFYPDSPEEHVLDQLVGKVEKMQDDRISTPDVLGVWAGDSSLDRELTELSDDESELAGRMAKLVKTFEDRTGEFVRDVQPFVAAGSADPSEMQRILELLDRAEPLASDGGALEGVVRETLGPSAFKSGSYSQTSRVDVPMIYRGPGVAAAYPAVTFDRNVAARFKSDDVEFITPFHPLVEALRAGARRRFLQVYSDGRSLAPRRLAMRIAGLGEPPTMVFTYLTSFRGGGDLLEEHLLAVRVGLDGKVIGSPLENRRLLEAANPGEASADRVVALFDEAFGRAREAAAASASTWARERMEKLREHRHRQAELLRAELATDLADRLREIDAEEGRARSVADDRGQQLLFEASDPRGPSFAVRRKAAHSQADERAAEIASYEVVDDASAPRPLGALFLVPGDVV